MLAFGMVSLRQRNRLNAMRHTQRVALPMFYEAGFDAVTVNDVAGAADLAASTLYRHFGSKEAIVLWDEHDPAIDEALERELTQQTKPFTAIRDALVDTVGRHYDADFVFQLPRIKYIFATEQLHAAAVEADFAARSELTVALDRFLSRPNKPAAPIIAGAALLALDVALDRWQLVNAKRSLGSLIEQSFAHLAQLETLS